MPDHMSAASARKGGEPLLAKDSVCGTPINEEQAAAKHESQDETFYF